LEKGFAGRAEGRALGRTAPNGFGVAEASLEWHFDHGFDQVFPITEDQAVTPRAVGADFIATISIRWLMGGIVKLVAEDGKRRAFFLDADARDDPAEPILLCRLWASGFSMGFMRIASKIPRAAEGVMTG